MSPVYYLENNDFDSEEEKKLKRELKMDSYYGVYSDTIRKRLQAFNVPKPETVYDVYDIIRKKLLAKNTYEENFFQLDE